MNIQLLSILYIEDNVDDVYMIRDILSHAKNMAIDLDSEETLQDGLNRLEEQTYDLLFLDLGLPDSFGLDTLHRVMQSNIDIPIIVVTGNDNEEDGVRSLEIGAQDFLAKGFITQRLLMKTIQYALARHEAKFDEQLRSKEKMDEMKQFNYIASHDLREPIRSIANYAQVMKEDYADLLPHEGINHLNAISNLSDRSIRLIKGLLDYSRLGRLLEPEETDMNELVGEVLESVDKLINETNTCIDVQPLPTLEVCPDVSQIFQNLISNAIKFRNADKPAAIKIWSEEERGQYVFHVQDNGVGIEPDYFERIFYIFQQVNPTQNTKGYGIGLAYCKKITELHKGRIWLDSVAGEGSTFHFTISKNL